MITLDGIYRIRHVGAGFTLGLPKGTTKEYARQLHDYIVPLIIDALRRGVPKKSIRQSVQDLRTYILDPELFEQEAQRHYRRWMAQLAEDSPLALYTRNGK